MDNALFDWWPALKIFTVAVFLVAWLTHWRRWQHARPAMKTKRWRLRRETYTPPPSPVPAEPLVTRGNLALALSPDPAPVPQTISALLTLPQPDFRSALQPVTEWAARLDFQAEGLAFTSYHALASVWKHLPLRPTYKQRSEMAACLGRLGLGIEPDIRFPRFLVDPDGQLIVFRSAPGTPAPGESYKDAMESAHILALWAEAGQPVPAALQHLMLSDADLPPQELLRLRAYTRWLLSAERPLLKLRRTLDTLPEERRSDLAQALRQAAKPTTVEQEAAWMQVLEWLDLSVPESEPKPAAPAPEIQNEANPAPARRFETLEPELPTPAEFRSEPGRSGAPAPEIQNEANPAPARISPVPRRVPPTPQPTRRPVLPVSRFQYPLLRCLSPHRPPAPPALKLLPPAPTPRLAPPAAFRPITRAIPSRKLLAAPREPVDPALSWMSYLGLRTPRTPDPDMDRPLIEPFWPCAGFLDFPRHEVDLTSLSAPPNCLSREEVTSGLRAHGRAEVTKALDVRRPTTCFR